MTVPINRIDDRSEVLRWPDPVSDLISARSDTNLVTGLNASDFDRNNCLRFPKEAATLVRQSITADNNTITADSTRYTADMAS